MKNGQRELPEQESKNGVVISLRAECNVALDGEGPEVMMRSLFEYNVRWLLGNGFAVDEIVSMIQNLDEKKGEKLDVVCQGRPFKINIPHIGKKDSELKRGA